MKQTVSSRKRFPKSLYVLAVIILIIVGWFIWVRASRPTSHAGIIPQTSPTVSSTPEASVESSVLPQPAGGAASQGAAAQATPVPGTPTQSTVVGQEPGQLKSGDSDATICTWSAGAQCYLTFTNQAGNTVKTSPVTIPASGSVRINWSVNGLGLTTGRWTVQAVGISAGKSVNASNPEWIYVN